MSVDDKQVRMRIDDEDAIRTRTGMKYRKEKKEHKSIERKFLFGKKETAKLQLVPGSHGMNIPSTCTIVIIAGRPQLKLPQ